MKTVRQFFSRVFALFKQIPWVADMLEDNSSVLSRSIDYFQDINSGAEAEGMVKDASVTLILKLFGLCLGFVYNIVLAKVLGVEGVGAYYLILSVTSIGLIISRLGLGNVLVRYVASHASRDEWGTVRNIYRSGLLIAFVTSVIVASIIIAASPLIMRTGFSEPELVVPLRIMALSVIPNTLYYLHGELFRGIKRFPYATFLQNICIHLVNIPIVLMLGRTFGILGVVASYAFSSLMVLLAGRTLWTRALPEEAKPFNRGLFAPRTLIASSIPLLWMTLAMTVSDSLDSFIIKSYLDIGSVGIYGVTKRVGMLIGFVFTSMNYVNEPRFSALYARNNMTELRAMARNSAFVSVIITAIPLSICLLFPRLILLVFGKEFVDGSVILQLFALGLFINVFAGSNGNLLMMSGREKLTRNGIIFSSISRLIAMFVLTQSHGVVGAALAFIISQIVENLYLSLQVYDKMGFFILPIPTKVRQTTG